MGPRFGAAREAVSTWWEARTPRERTLLLAVGSVAAVALIHSALWEPADTGRARVAARLPALRTQWVAMRAEADAARRLRAATAAHAPTGGALRDALSASLTQAGLAGAQLMVAGNAIQIDIKSVPFGAWMDWLERARREQHVRVAAAHASAGGKPGIATVSATLQLAAAP
ncbi:type II secretion system protein GspM [Burkholderia plantarii]|uniref:type II secretion system protein GspM n=1 Tax=Burkholderia plantarii TaxID=41899 RepID=UPI0008708C45|nr:type II secretion system protein M [Burkholderia plantarii]